MPWIFGDKLPEHLKREVLNRYPYRMTHESVQRWPRAAQRMYESGYRMPIINDEERLKVTEFSTTPDGIHLDKRSFHCRSHRSRKEAC